MCGVLEGSSYMTGKLSHFGYVKISPNGDNPYLKEGEYVRGHEFHYYDTSDNGEIVTVEKLSGTQKWMGYQSRGNVFAGFPHLFYPSCEIMIERFLGL